MIKAKRSVLIRIRIICRIVMCVCVLVCGCVWVCVLISKKCVFSPTCLLPPGQNTCHRLWGARWFLTYPKWWYNIDPSCPTPNIQRGRNNRKWERRQRNKPVPTSLLFQVNPAPNKKMGATMSVAPSPRPIRGTTSQPKFSFDVHGIWAWKQKKDVHRHHQPDILGVGYFFGGKKGGLSCKSCHLLVAPKTKSI